MLWFIQLVYKVFGIPYTVYQIGVLNPVTHIIGVTIIIDGEVSFWLLPWPLVHHRSRTKPIFTAQISSMAELINISQWLITKVKGIGVLLSAPVSFCVQNDYFWALSILPIGIWIKRLRFIWFKTRRQKNFKGFFYQSTINTIRFCIP